MINQQKLLLWLLIILKISTPSNVIHAEQDDVDPKKNNKALLIGIGGLLGGGAVGAIAMYFYNVPESNTPPDLTALQKKLQTKETEIKQKDQLITQKTEELQQKDRDNKKNYETFQENNRKKQSKITELEEQINDLKDPDKLGEKVTQLTKENIRLKQNLSKLQQQYHKTVEEKRAAVTQLQEKTQENKKAFELIQACQKQNELLRKKLLENKLQQEVKVLMELEKTKDQKIEDLEGIVELYKSNLEEEKIKNQELLKANQNLVKRLEKFEKLSIKINDINNDEEDEKHSSSEDELSSSPVNSNHVHVPVNKNLEKKARNWPKKDNQIVYALTNQYKERGFAVCLLASAILIRTSLRSGYVRDLYDKQVLNQVCVEAANDNNRRDKRWALYFLTILDDCKEKYFLQRVDTKNTLPGFGVPRCLSSQKDVKEDIQDAWKKGYRHALLKNGPEAWALLIHTDYTFSIFDSHGKTKDNNNEYAYIRHFSKLEDLSKFIIDNNPLMTIPVDELNEQKKQDGGIFLYWVKLYEGNRNNNFN